MAWAGKGLAGVGSWHRREDLKETHDAVSPVVSTEPFACVGKRVLILLPVCLPKGTIFSFLICKITIHRRTGCSAVSLGSGGEWTGF